MPVVPHITHVIQCICVFYKLIIGTHDRGLLISLLPAHFPSSPFSLLRIHHLPAHFCQKSISLLSVKFSQFKPNIRMKVTKAQHIFHVYDQISASKSFMPVEVKREHYYLHTSSIILFPFPPHSPCGPCTVLPHPSSISIPL